MQPENPAPPDDQNRTQHRKKHEGKMDQYHDIRKNAVRQHHFPIFLQPDKNRLISD
jgi:hypothetical protein